MVGQIKGTKYNKKSAVRLDKLNFCKSQLAYLFLTYDRYWQPINSRWHCGIDPPVPRAEKV